MQKKCFFHLSRVRGHEEIWQTRPRLPSMFSLLIEAGCATVKAEIMSNVFGELFRISTWGESHGAGIGVVVDGCPPNIPLKREMIQEELDRRRPGQSSLTTARREGDEVEILSGVSQSGKTLGTPVALLVRNTDARSSAYDEMRHAYRPSHADYTYDAKYGIREAAGGGRASARETIGRVAAGAVAKAVLAELCPHMQVVAWVKQVGSVRCETLPEQVERSVVESNPVRAADLTAAERMREAIEEARSKGDSLGGVIGCVVRYAPAGLGDPVFDKLEATLGHAMLSIPACKGFEVGSGFAAAEMFGSQHNDAFYMSGNDVRTRTNHSGGIQGGISNGEDIVMHLAFKPTATIMSEQETVTDERQATTLCGKGRHDPCVLPRAVPIVESMAWLVLLDHVLRQRAQCGVIPEPRAAMAKRQGD